MRVLGIESCADIGSVAIIDDGKVVGEITVNVKKKHSITLAPMVDNLLKLVSCELKELDAIAIDVGPGSFTGLRIGIALAASLAYGADLPVVRVSGLDALLEVGKRLAGDNIVEVIPVIYGRHNEAYVLYADEYMVVDIDEFLTILKRDSKYLFIGDGCLFFRDKIKGCGLEVITIDDSFHNLSGSVIANSGILGMIKGEGISPLLVEPMYLRRPEVDVILERKIKLNDNC